MRKQGEELIVDDGGVNVDPVRVRLSVFGGQGHRATSTSRGTGEGALPVHFRIDEIPPKITHGRFHFDSVDENHNVAIFRPENDATQTASFPLDMITTVFKDDKSWNVTLRRYEAPH